MLASLRDGGVRPGKRIEVAVGGQAVEVFEGDFEIAERTGRSLVDVLTMPMDEAAAWRVHMSRNPWWGWRGVQRLLAQALAMQAQAPEGDRFYWQDFAPWLAPGFDHEKVELARREAKLPPDLRKARHLSVEDREAIVARRNA